MDTAYAVWIYLQAEAVCCPSPDAKLKVSKFHLRDDFESNASVYSTKLYVIQSINAYKHISAFMTLQNYTIQFTTVQ